MTPRCFMNRTRDRVVTECEEAPTKVVLVRTYMEGDPNHPMPEFWPVLTCEGHAPALAQELAADEEDPEDLITATIDTEENR